MTCIACQSLKLDFNTEMISGQFSKSEQIALSNCLIANHYLTILEFSSEVVIY